MTSQLVCRPEQDRPVAVLRVSGVLDLITGDALKIAIARLLSGQPEALLIDAARLEISDPSGLRVLRDVVCETSDWPAVPIVLCGAGPATAAAVAASADCADVGTAPDTGRALRELSHRAGPPRLRLRLRPVPDACRQVRQLVDHACRAWHRGEIAATASVVATELVANVVRHAHTTMEFTVGLRDGTMWLSVRDGSRRLPRLADPAVTDTGGRGLRLVRELTDAWGVLTVSDGKVVWTRLSAGPAL